MTKTSNDSNALKPFEQRKQDHIHFALAKKNEAIGISGLDRLHFNHEALPDLDFNEINITTTSLGKTLATPFLVSSMTAGHQGAIHINHVLARACEQQGWAMGVGSQRRQLLDASATGEWQAIRDIAPSIRLFGNIGISQLIQTPIKTIASLADSLQADAMIIHTNPLQECLQPEGTPQFKGCFEALARLCDDLSIPVILKETGCGFSARTLQRLTNIGIAAVDISGLGGTHWGRIEGDRATNNDPRHFAAKTFKDWGINTVDALIAAAALNPPYEMWASGGVRSGLDAAKLIALGARMVGFAKPMLQAALRGSDAVIQHMQTLEYELKTALFCTGSATLSALQDNKLCP